MSAMTDRDSKPAGRAADPWAGRRRKNAALFAAVLALAALFFVITILRMS